MDEKNKVFVFDKKEVALIFIFMLLTALTSFAVGVKVGRNFSLHLAGITPEDQKAVQLKSIAEENMDQVIQETQAHKTVEVGKQENSDKTYQKLEEEFEKMNRQIINSETKTTTSTATTTTNATEHTTAELATTSERAPASSAITTQSHEATADIIDNHSEKPKVALSGKYTIQLGSYQQESDAIKFADGFRIRGYNPILSEVRIPDKGIWYRVSLGTFNSISEAKEYISKEESLFQGQDYVITEFN
ncbi:MAG: SPOR domain-containing protein [Oligoflexia bacterium]|nr:SPOR domain-containing protein [Oligoflexia bacterium]MBF0365075.1 SPOR domain-containing protein [Oligoflexia bacterium]